jgi:hypothetical protein
MVLDDVFQSVDGPIRVAALHYVLSDLNGWQFFLTAHDRLWREQVLTILHRHGRAVTSLEIASWDPEHGPEIRASTGDLGSAVHAALQAGDAVSIAVQAGRLVELTSHHLSWTLPVSVTRRRDDRYTLNDVSAPVYKKLKGLTTAPAADLVDRHLHLRNLLGAHVNDWAGVTSVAEARRFGEAALELLNFCPVPQCLRWIERSPEAHTYVCRSGTTRVTKPPSVVDAPRP